MTTPEIIAAVMADGQPRSRREIWYAALAANHSVTLRQIEHNVGLLVIQGGLIRTGARGATIMFQAAGSVRRVAAPIDRFLRRAA